MRRFGGMGEMRFNHGRTPAYCFATCLAMWSFIIRSTSSVVYTSPLSASPSATRRSSYASIFSSISCISSHVEAKAGINTQAKSLKVYRKLISPPFAVRTSLADAKEGTETKDIPLFALGPSVRRLLDGVA